MKTKETEYPITVSLQADPETAQRIIMGLKDFMVDGVLQLEFLNGKVWLTGGIEGNIIFNFRQDCNYNYTPIITKMVGGSIDRVRLSPHPEIKRGMNTKLGIVKDIFLGGDRIWVQLENNTTIKLDLTTINKLV